MKKPREEGHENKKKNEDQPPPLFFRLLYPPSLPTAAPRPILDSALHTQSRTKKNTHTIAIQRHHLTTLFFLHTRVPTRTASVRPRGARWPGSGRCWRFFDPSFTTICIHIFFDGGGGGGGAPRIETALLHTPRGRPPAWPASSFFFHGGARTLSPPPSVSRRRPPTWTRAWEHTHTRTRWKTQKKKRRAIVFLLCKRKTHTTPPPCSLDRPDLRHLPRLSPGPQRRHYARPQLLPRVRVQAAGARRQEVRVETPRAVDRAQRAGCHRQPDGGAQGGREQELGLGIGLPGAAGAGGTNRFFWGGSRRVGHSVHPPRPHRPTILTDCRRRPTPCCPSARACRRTGRGARGAGRGLLPLLRRVTSGWVGGGGDSGPTHTGRVREACGRARCV